MHRGHAAHFFQLLCLQSAWHPGAAPSVCAPHANVFLSTYHSQAYEDGQELQQFFESLLKSLPPPNTPLNRSGASSEVTRGRGRGRARGRKRGAAVDAGIYIYIYVCVFVVFDCPIISHQAGRPVSKRSFNASDDEDAPAAADQQPAVRSPLDHACLYFNAGFLMQRCSPVTARSLN